VTADASKHVFSNHDNKEAILTDACIFDHGVGKRKVKTKLSANITAWQESVEDRNSTFYQREYCRYFPEKLLTGRQAVENRPLSNYRHSYNSDHVEANDYKASRIEKLRRYIQIQNLQNRPKTCTSSVASCLVWHDKLERSSNTVVPSAQQQSPGEFVNSRPKTVAVCNRTPLVQTHSVAEANDDNDD
jgi:hypothetical protein